MKLLIQIAILATFVATIASAVDPTKLRRQLGNKKSRSFQLESLDAHVDGEIGVRQQCNDKRFTLVCEWEANKKKKKKYYKSRRALTQGVMDFDEDAAEDKDNEVAANDVGGRELETIVHDGRRLGVELDNVECILGVGKKDSDDSSEDYEEYKERLKFPDDAWKIKIRKAEDALGAITGNPNDRDFYLFGRVVKFEDIEDPNNSGDEITIEGTLQIELICEDKVDPAIFGYDEILYIDETKLSFKC